MTPAVPTTSWFHHLPEDVRERYVDIEIRVRRAKAPLDVLRALADRKALRDELERVAVTEARQSGATWEEIGEALRLPRQAVHRRFAGRVNSEE